MKEKMNHTCQYKISVEGHLPSEWMDWPSDTKIHHAFDQEGSRAITLISVSLPDQPALYGLLEKLRDLNIKLIYAQRDE